MTQLYEQSRPQLRAVAARYVGDEAEDVVQDAFINALRSSHTFRGDAAPLTWLHRIVVNACLNHCRKRNRREHSHHRPLGYLILADASVEDTLAIRTALRELTSDQYRVFVMYEVIGYTHREIAGLLAIPRSTSKSRLAEARRRLQELLSERHGTVTSRRRRRERRWTVNSGKLQTKPSEISGSAS